MQSKLSVKGQRQSKHLCVNTYCSRRATINKDGGYCYRCAETIKTVHHMLEAGIVKADRKTDVQKSAESLGIWIPDKK